MGNHTPTPRYDPILGHWSDVWPFSGRACPSDYGITYFEIRKSFRWAELSIAGPAHQFALLLHVFTLRLGPSQDREDLVTKGGVALVRHCVRAQPDGLGVGLHAAVVRCGCARAICHLLVHTVGLSIAERKSNISTRGGKKVSGFGDVEYTAIPACLYAHVIIIKVWRLVWMWYHWTVFTVSTAVLAFFG